MLEVLDSKPNIYIEKIETRVEELEFERPFHHLERLT